MFLIFFTLLSLLILLFLLSFQRAHRHHEELLCPDRITLCSQVISLALPMGWGTLFFGLLQEWLSEVTWEISSGVLPNACPNPRASNDVLRVTDHKSLRKIIFLVLYICFLISMSTSFFISEQRHPRDLSCQHEDTRMDE